MISMFKKPVTVNVLKRYTGWVLDGLIRDAASYNKVPIRWNVFSSRKLDFRDFRVIRSEIVPYRGAISIFGHHDSYFKVHNREFTSNSMNRIFLTHLNEGREFSEIEIELLSNTDRLFVQNMRYRQELVSRGIPESKIFQAPGAIDRNVFFPLEQPPQTEYVLISGFFKYRKNPDLYSEVIQSLPETNFIIHGKYLSEFPAGLLEKNPNVTWIDFKYSNHPLLVRNSSLYLSLSRIEGGPIGILEALASGVPVVATDTGFASEYLTSDNGYLLKNLPDAKDVATAVQMILERHRNSRRQDFLGGRLTWEELARTFFDA